MGDDTKTLTLNQSLLDCLLSLYKFRERNFAFTLRLFLSNQYHIIDHFLLSLDSLGRSEFRDETFSLLNCLSDSCLDFVTANKMGGDPQTLTPLHDLLNRFLGRRKLFHRNFAF